MTAIRPCGAGDAAALAALWRACGLTRPWNDPAGDIETALDSPAATLLCVDAGAGGLAGSVMAGFDGHRGWVYYLAVHPDRRGAGLARALMKAAEDWLAARGCRKLNLMVRPDNTGVKAAYFAMGYVQEDRAVLSKWLTPPPVRPPELFDRPLSVTVTHLEMTERPRAPLPPAPVLDRPLGLARLTRPPVGYYRYLQQTIGEPWLWWERKAMSDADLEAIVHDEAVEVHQLTLGGAPAGMAELDFREMPARADLAYFGLMPWAIGIGLGGHLLRWAVERLWEGGPDRITVNTCTLDHPAALGLYQKVGFRPVRRDTKQVPDPRGRGLIAPHIRVRGQDEG